MTCTTNHPGIYQWSNQPPISFTEWKTILSKLPVNDNSKISSSSSDLQRRSKTKTKKSERLPLGRNQVFSDGVIDSFLVSSTIAIARQDVPKILAPPSKPYVSSFKTLVNAANDRQTQRLSYINDSVVIFKLSKDHGNDQSSVVNSNVSSKHSSLSMATTTTLMSTKPIQQQQQQPPLPTRLSPLLKVEGQKQRIVHHETPSIIVPSIVDISIPPNTTNPMATSTTTQPRSNSPVFTYRSAAAGGNTVRQRAITETTSNSLLISAERFKSNLTAQIRQTRPTVTNTTTTISTTYISSQPTQRSIKTRLSQDKLANSREAFDYPDPFTNCPQDILSKLSQLTKLQLETIDWEKKKRFTKKKPLTTTSTVQGKDSP